ncbi:histidine phosphatase family protein [Streptomyces bacillaris]|uniref:histidine phosphatase family protein n=1 Tax=Streptomyces bacillaris TaxID=68179 RepID=UPI003460540F
MTTAATRYLHLLRHGEATPDESGLTGNGRRQAALLGHRLRGVPFAAVHHGPLPRAEETARLIHAELADASPSTARSRPAATPPLPAQGRTPAGIGRLLPPLPRRPPEEQEQGAAPARRALDRFTGPVEGEGGEDRHELVVTHNFLVAWLVRDAMRAPAWRRLGLNHANAALTVIRYAPGRPATVLPANDMRHLPADLRWTGLPPELHI